MNIDHLTVFVGRELGVTQLDPGLGSHSYDVLRGCQHLAVQLGVGEPMANGWRPQSLTMWASSPTASCDLTTEQLSPPRMSVPRKKQRNRNTFQDLVLEVIHHQSHHN